MRKPVSFVACALALLLAGCRTASPPPTPPAPQPYTRIANPDTNTVALQIALRRFVPAHHKGPAIWLAAVMHVGEPEYYKSLQQFLDGQTVVLYEGVNSDAHPRHVRDGNALPPPRPPRKHTGTNEGYSMQSSLARSLGLVFQLEAIDYDRTNFLNSDLSISQIKRIMSESHSGGHAGAAGGGGAASFDALLHIMDGSSFMGSLFKVGMQFLAGDPKLRAIAKLTLIEAIGRLNGDMSEMQGLPPDLKELMRVLIQERNENLVADLKTELKQLPRSGTVAVFYGAGHMDDLEKRITGDLNYRPAGETWLTAFSVDLHKSGISADEARMMRNMIKGQLQQMKSF